jgi:soluble lytic murein transglycosylase-like protein
MTTQSLSCSKAAASSGRAFPALAGSVLALLSLALLPASTVGVKVQAPRPTAPLAAKAGRLLSAGVVSADARPLVPSGNDALAGILARKYRVSEVAARQFVVAAHVEGRRSGVDPLLIIAVMAIESRFNPVAQSDGGAIGLMQVIPRYHAEKFEPGNHNSVLDPVTNIQVGARILRECIARGGNETAGLQLYNGATSDPANAYATRVLGEKQWLQETLRRAKDRRRA